MRALLAKSQFVEIQRLTAFGPRFLKEGLKLRAQTLIVDNFFPTLITLCKLTELVIHGAAFGLRKQSHRPFSGSKNACRARWLEIAGFAAWP